MDKRKFKIRDKVQHKITGDKLEIHNFQKEDNIGEYIYYCHNVTQGYDWCYFEGELEPVCKNSVTGAVSVPQSLEIEMAEYQDGVISFDDLNLTDPTAEPKCECSFHGFGHDPDCKWLKWKQENRND